VRPVGGFFWMIRGDDILTNGLVDSLSVGGNTFVQQLPGNFKFVIN